MRRAGEYADFSCIMQVKFCYSEMMTRTASHARRSACPLNVSVEMLGDRWSLLILRT